MKHVDWRESDLTIIDRAPLVKRPRGNNGGKTRNDIIDLIAAFDIETSVITCQGEEEAICYVWMFYILGSDAVITGRDLSEWAAFSAVLAERLKGKTLLCWVHNLSYEFQFLKSWIEIKNDSVFALEKRKILKFLTADESIEYRCSYIQTNMSLDEFTHKMGVEHAKIKGFDYKKPRFPWTELTEFEWEYCCSDVVGLCEAMRVQLITDHDTLYTVPLTSTGYVRRDAKRAMKNASFTLISSIVPDMDLYIMLREAFRGGNTHANRYYAGEIINDVNSADRSSSYPDVIVNCKFPMSRFVKEKDANLERVHSLINVRGKAVLFRVKFWQVRLRKTTWPCPYISYSKCRDFNGRVIETRKQLKACGIIEDNGRILSAEYFETTFTDIDYKIFLSEYKFTACQVVDCYSSRYAYLPNPLRDQTLEYYDRKTRLKGVKGEEVYYMKAKNKLNSLYGMTAQDPVKDGLIFDGFDFFNEGRPAEELLDEYNKKAFLTYQWGVWVTAWARLRLEEGIRLAGDRFVYADTDSVKYIGEIDWSAYNAEREQDSRKNGACALDSRGCTHYMGVYEDDGHYTAFRTWGAKKYAYTALGDNSTHVTIAGVNKRRGGTELDNAARAENCTGLEMFKPGFIFREAGGSELVYNDLRESIKTFIDSHELEIRSNVVIRDSTYLVGITDAYYNLIYEKPLIFS